MKKTISILAMLLSNSTLALQTEKIDEENNVVSIGPQTVTVVSDGSTRVTIGEARVGPRRPEVGATKTVGANPAEAKGLFWEVDSQKKGPQTVTATALEGVTLKGGTTVRTPAVSASKYHITFGTDAPTPANSPSTLLTQPGTVYVKARELRTENSVRVVGYDEKVDGPLPKDTQVLVIDGLQAYGERLVFGSGSNKK